MCFVLVQMRCILAVLICLHVDADKLRYWLDASKTLLEGSIPSPRYAHGFTAIEDDQIYVFGGKLLFNSGAVISLLCTISSSRISYILEYQ